MGHQDKHLCSKVFAGESGHVLFSITCYLCTKLLLTTFATAGKASIQAKGPSVLHCTHPEAAQRHTRQLNGFFSICMCKGWN